MAKIIDDEFDETEMFSAAAIGAKLDAIDEKLEPLGNPLAAYFRIPGVTTPLPTGGRFLPEGAIQLDETGRIEVYPMTSADELLLKAPDALMSGLAIEKLIASCIPGIKTPQLISAPDLDVMLIAIRAATYGNMMPVEVECPKCETELSFDCDLSLVLATLKELPTDLDLRLSNDVVVTMRPHTMVQQTRLLLAAYDEQRRAQNIDEDELTDDQRKALYSDTLDRFTGFQATSLSNGISKISVPHNEVTDRKYIEEFVRKTTKQWSSAIQTRLEEINSMGIDREVPVTCTKCEHEWKTKLEFNPSTFFDQRS